jgi:hypothetical protein
LPGTDGSVTQLLESVTGKKVGIRTLVQEILPAERAAADNLSIAEGDPVNYRVVEIRTEEGGGNVHGRVFRGYDAHHQGPEQRGDGPGSVNKKCKIKKKTFPERLFPNLH